MRILLFVSLILVCIESAIADQFQIEFSGTFGFCPAQALCAGSPLATLPGTGLSGQVLIPTTGIDLDKKNDQLGSFSYGEGFGSFTISTLSSQVNTTEAVPVAVTVNFCAQGGCGSTQDSMVIVLSTPQFNYTLTFTGTGMPSLEDDHVPPLSVLEVLTESARLEVETANQQSLVITPTVSAAITEISNSVAQVDPIPAVVGGANLLLR